MTRIEIEGFRCFGERQEARLAPLTLLVGENSTGKTSLLAMVRALREALATGPNADFKTAPFDFGSFDDMAYRGGSDGEGRASRFRGALTFKTPDMGEPFTFAATFAKSGNDPLLVRRHHETAGYEFAVSSHPPPGSVAIRTPTGVVEARWNQAMSRILPSLPPSVVLNLLGASVTNPNESAPLEVIRGSIAEVRDVWGKVEAVFAPRLPTGGDHAGTYAGAPVRSRPRRNYSASPGKETAEGDSIPRRLADLSGEGSPKWQRIERGLVDFGAGSGLFTGVEVRPVGEEDSDPFQILVGGRGPDGTHVERNLKDVGYGVSQALPILVEILDRKPGQVFLLQQPEVHLHPQAQAALGSLFVVAAAEGRQLLVETHSDHLLDRVRMDVRDGRTTLRPEDVSILYFERQGLGVRISSLGLDGEGNVLNAPDSYRRFFLEETERALGL